MTKREVTKMLLKVDCLPNDIGEAVVHTLNLSLDQNGRSTDDDDVALMLARDSGKPDQSQGVDEMTKESTPESGSEKLKRYWNQRYYFL